MSKRESRDSPEFKLRWDVCRECRCIQPCADIRGWQLCLRCVEGIDRKFCEQRAGQFFAQRSPSWPLCSRCETPLLSAVGDISAASLFCPMCDEPHKTETDKP